MSFNPLNRTVSFCASYNLQLPILMAPMAGACPASLAIAVANGGGIAACSCLLIQPDEITEWALQKRAGANGAFELNIWIPDPDPQRDPAHEEKLRAFLSQRGFSAPPKAAPSPE